MAILHLSAYDAEAAVFIIEVGGGENEEESGRQIRRTFQDLMRLNRKIRKLQPPPAIGMPSKNIKMLSSVGSWRLYKEGWRSDLIKSVRAFQSWLDQLRCPGDFEEFTDDFCYGALKRRLRQRADEIVRSKHLQQYFCSDENMELLLDIATHGLDPASNEYIVLEPSCGDGRVLRRIAGRGFPAIGCDIDPVIIATARMQTPPSVPIVQSNFLELSASMVRAAFDEATLESIDTASAQKRPVVMSKCRPDSSVRMAERKVIVLGCPPFSVFSCSLSGSSCCSSNCEQGGASREVNSEHGDKCVRDNTRDIVMDFFRHCGRSGSSPGVRKKDGCAVGKTARPPSSKDNAIPIDYSTEGAIGDSGGEGSKLAVGLGLDVRRIVFLLPVRCDSHTFISSALAALNGADIEADGSNANVEECSIGGSYGSDNVGVVDVENDTHGHNEEPERQTHGRTQGQGESSRKLASSWRFVCSYKADSHFHIGSSEIVKQPATIQLWECS